MAPINDPINNELKLNALVQCIDSNDDTLSPTPPPPPPPLQSSDFRLMHMNEEQLYDLHEHNKAAGVDNY